MGKRETLQKKKEIPEALENGERSSKTDVRGKILDNGKGTRMREKHLAMEEESREPWQREEEPWRREEEP
jgi:hypothetical protein